MTSSATANTTGTSSIKINNDPPNPNTFSPKKSSGKRKSASLPSETVEYLKAWMMSPEHIAHPYPTEQEKVEIMKDTKIELKQLTNWFVNNRKRYWKPRVEARLQQQAQAAQAAVQAHAAAVAAVSATKSLAQQPQLLPGVTADPARSNLVSPPVFKFAARPTLTAEVIKPPLIQLETVSPPVGSLNKKAFVSSPLTLGTQIMQRPPEPVLPFSRPPAVVASVTETPSAISATSATPASVSASEGEMSDSGNTSDDASSEGANFLLNDLKFINLKMKKKHFLKSRVTCIEPTTFSSETPEENTDGTTSHARNVSFCSLDKIPSEATPSTHSQESESPSTSYSKKRPNIDNELPLVVATCTSHVPPGKRFRTVSLDLWRKKCQDATHVHDETLPSLEEATRLFGFTSA